MQPVNQHTPDANVETRYRVLLIIWFAMLTSIGMFFFLTTFIPRPATEKNAVLSLTFTALAAFLPIVSFVPKQKMLKQAAERQQPQLVQTAYIIAFALTEAAALFCLLTYFLTPDSYLIQFALPVIFMLLHFPRRDHLLAASFKKQ